MGLVMNSALKGSKDSGPKAARDLKPRMLAVFPKQETFRGPFLRIEEHGGWLGARGGCRAARGLEPWAHGGWIGE